MGPGRAERGGPIPDAHRSYAGLECGAKGSVLVANEIFRCAVPRKRFGDLARKPLCRWVSGHRNPQQLPPSMAENKKREQLLKGNRRNHKEINRCDAVSVVVKEGLPCLRRSTSSSVLCISTLSTGPPRSPASEAHRGCAAHPKAGSRNSYFE